MAGEATAIAGISAAIWLYLVTLRGGFWRARERLDDGLPAPGDWPRVVALVPARDEAEVIGRAVESLLAQDYPGPLGVVVCDDHSDDGTAAAAQQAAGRSRRPGHLSVVAARPLPAGWSGKLWTLNEALVQAEARWPEADYLLLSDADVAHGPETLRLLVAKAERERRDLVSLMVTLSCHGPWARMLIPPFVYFFQLLYPFAWVNDPARRTAAAAGGCVLLRHDALTRAGGFESIRGELIDDCALARRIKGLGRSEGSAKKVGNIWLGLGVASHSLRPYGGLGDIWRMVARSAYTQLRHAPALLIAALLGLMLTFVAPPLIGLGAVARGHDLAATIGLATWAAMAATAIPIYRLYQQPPWLAACLPLSAALYAAMTLDSARRHWRGHGGVWKGRAGPDADRRPEVAPNANDL